MITTCLFTLSDILVAIAVGIVSHVLYVDYKNYLEDSKMHSRK